MKCTNFEFLPMCDLPISENHHFLNITSHGLVPLCQHLVFKCQIQNNGIIGYMLAMICDDVYMYMYISLYL